MYTSYIGLKFLAIYNKREGKNLTAHDFFDSEVFPLFFENERHLMHVSNSPFFQNPAEKELKQSGLSRSRFQYHKLQQKITLATVDGDSPDASIYVGFAANGPDQTTSGQVSTLPFVTTSDELYASWIGNALAARVEGSQCLLIDSEEVLWHLYNGWKMYRKYIEPVKAMDGRQIETWNGYWMARGLSGGAVSPPTKGNKLETVPWLEVIASLLQWHSGEVLPAYIFSLGQTNTTYGFINLRLPELTRLREASLLVKKSVFSMEDEDEKSFWEHYPIKFSLRNACEQGEIGLRSLQPKDYAKFLEDAPGAIKINEKNKLQFLNIKTWIIAMLNNKSDLQELASSMAAEMIAAEAVAKKATKDRGKTSDSDDSKAILEANGLTNFINALSIFLEKNDAAATICRKVVDKSVRIPGEQLPLFKALIRFEYIYSKNNSSI